MIRPAPSSTSGALIAARFAREPGVLLTTVAVTGAAGSVAAAVLHRLARDEAIANLVGVDVDEPSMPPAKLEFRTADIRDPLLPNALRGVDVVVHLAMTPGPVVDEDEMFAVNVSGTRNLLAAADAVGVSHLVHVSSGVVYGAHEDNVIPIPETARLRADADFPWAFHHVLAEELVAQWTRAHPDAVVTVLRPAMVLGPNIDTTLTRHLEQPVLPFVKGSDPPLQVVAVEDLADAVAFVIERRLPGPFNVAADGWLTSRDVSHILGRPMVHLPEVVAEVGAAALWSRKIVAAPPGALHYLMEPWVLSGERLHNAGWAPTRSNREVLRDFAAEHHAWVSVGTWRAKRRHVGSVVFGTPVAGALALAVLRRRSGRRRLRGVLGS